MPLAGSPFKCADRLTRWPRPVMRLQRAIDHINLELSLSNDLARRLVLVARRRELLAGIETAKRAVLMRETAA
jgi:hypothetical protein